MLQSARNVMRGTDEQQAIAGFDILAKLSSGGMGDVLLARRRGAHGFEKLLAIKTIRGDLARRPDIRAMFNDEARLVARLDHPTIAQVYDFGEQGETLFLAMEYVPGIALNKLLGKRSGPFPPIVAMRMVAEVCRGLHAAHELCDKDGTSLGVVHRDVTPGNLILTFDGHMKILDFGIAFTKGRESPDTVIGELKGKPSYMAPEHLRGERVDRRADLYSISVVLHELLTGKKLFSRNTVVATVLAVETAEIPRPSSLAGPLPPGLDDIVLKGLERNAENRFPDARALAAALDRLIGVEPTAPQETLEAFVEAELKEERDTHRVWMNGVLIDAEAGGTADSARTLPEPPRVLRTSSAPLTPAGRKLSAAVLDAPLAESTTLVPQGFDHSQPVTAIRRPYQNGLIWLAALLGGAAAAWFGYHTMYEQGQPDPRDVSLIEIHDKPEVQAPVEKAATATASARVMEEKEPEKALEKEPEKGPPEEPHHATHHPARHAPPAKRHAADKHEGKGEAQLAKAEEPKPQGSGFITVGAQPYALVRIDGQEIGATPIMNKRLAAGTHEIELVRPDTGEVRLKKTLTLKDGDHERVMIP